MQVKQEYETAFDTLVKNPQSEDAQTVRDKVLDRHNEYVLQLKAANRTIEQFKHTLPEVLEVSVLFVFWLSVLFMFCWKRHPSIESRHENHRAVQTHAARGSRG